MPNSVRYVKLGNVPPAVGDNGVRGLEDALARLDVGHKLAPRNYAQAQLSRALSKLGLVRPIARLSRTAYLIPAGQGAQPRFFPVTYFHDAIPWIFDAWPNLWPRIEGILRRQRVRLAFVSARQSADHFRAALGIDVVWLPEACDPARFDPSKPLRDRSIDVLELGRRHDRYHDGITSDLLARRATHLYEPVKGQLIFPDDPSMHAGFNDAKISVCFPSSMTHPARSGHVETVTLRYFESMAAKCVLVGHCPSELIDLMGYDPVVPADMADPPAQIGHILDHVLDYQALVDRNYARLLETGVWDVRVRQLLDELRVRGYHP